MLTLLRDMVAHKGHANAAVLAAVGGSESASADGELVDLMTAATEADCAATLTDPLIPGGQCSVGDALTQVCLHSHAHRAQIARMLRRHGVVPPHTDLVLWLTERRAPEWDTRPIPAVTCPLCGGANECAAASSGSFDTPCWCRDATFNAELIARVPEPQRGPACICRQCGSAG